MHDFVNLSRPVMACDAAGRPIGLHYGRGRRPLLCIVPDARHPGMWRVLSPNGELSDIVNLTRAKDAALAIAERGPPARDRRRFNWRPLEDRQIWPLVNFHGLAGIKALVRAGRTTGRATTSSSGVPGSSPTV